MILCHKTFCLFVIYSVMILGVLLARKTYPLLKYLCVFLIVFGVTIFMYKDVSSIPTVFTPLFNVVCLIEPSALGCCTNPFTPETKKRGQRTSKV